MNKFTWENYKKNALGKHIEYCECHIEKRDVVIAERDVVIAVFEIKIIL